MGQNKVAVLYARHTKRSQGTILPLPSCLIGSNHEPGSLRRHRGCDSLYAFMDFDKCRCMISATRGQESRSSTPLNVVFIKGASRGADGGVVVMVYFE
jgi:hypothetical protein